MTGSISGSDVAMMGITDSIMSGRVQWNTTHHCRLQQAPVPTRLREKEQGLEKLSPGCKSLVLLAEPGDAYGAYQSLLSAGMVVCNMRKIESNFGLKVRPHLPLVMQALNDPALVEV